MKRWAVYNQNGSISHIYSGSDNEALMQPVGDQQIALTPELLDDSNAYVVGGVVVEKAPMALTTINTPLRADGIDEMTISGIPEGVQVRWPDGFTHIENNGSVGFKVDLPGIYTFRFTGTPYLDQEVTLEAVPAT